MGQRCLRDCRCEALYDLDITDDFEPLCSACRFCSVSVGVLGISSTDELYDLLRRALDAWTRPCRPRSGTASPPSPWRTPRCWTTFAPRASSTDPAVRDLYRSVFDS